MTRKPASALRINPQDPRWFEDESGRAMVLVGFHTWSNLADMWRGEKRIAFDFGWYLDEMESLGHNFIRLWTWHSLCTWDSRDRVAPFPWARTGPGQAPDGLPKFDLNVFDPEYFSRLEERVALAHERGIYVGVMLFESWEAYSGNTTPINWHIFAGDSNINDIDSTAHLVNGWMVDVMAKGSEEVLQIQEAYVRKVVRLLNPYPNVLFEISNEAGGDSYEWQEHMVRIIREEESQLPFQHLVGITGGMGTKDEKFFHLDADWLAPEGWSPDGEAAPYREGNALYGTPPETSRGPIMLDTDHLWGIGGNVRWAWQSFLRGYHPLYMDKISDQKFRIFEHPWWPEDTNLDLRTELGVIRRTSLQVELSSMVSSSSDWALIGPRHALALSISGQAVTLTLEPGKWKGRWKGVPAGQETPVETEGGTHTFESPFLEDAVLLLEKT